MRTATALTLTLALLGAAAPAGAQVLVLDAEYEGELGPDDEAALTRALEQGLERGAPGRVRPADQTRDAIGDLAACDGDRDCIIAIGRAVSASVAVRAAVHAEAEIYDFTVRIYDLASGDTLVTQIGDCTFCPVAEAVDAFGFTAEAAIATVDPLPPPTPGTVEPEPLVTTPIPVAPEPEPAMPVEPIPAVLPGEIPLDVSVVPATAAIVLNGQPAGAGRARLSVAPQRLLVEIAAPGYEAYVEDVTLLPSMAGPIFLRVVLTPEAAGRIAQAPAPPRSRGPGHPTAGAILAGSGLAAATAGILLLAADGGTTCDTGPSAHCAEVWEFTAGGATLTAAGGVALGTGIGLLVDALAGRRDRADSGPDARRAHAATTGDARP